jgi:hypothetical protein
MVKGQAQFVLTSNALNYLTAAWNRIFRNYAKVIKVWMPDLVGELLNMPDIIFREETQDY